MPEINEIFYPTIEAFPYQRTNPHKVPTFPQAISPPPLHRTPLEAFAMDQPWDDWTTLYTHRKYLETNVQPADLKLPTPRAHTPLDAFGMDAPWDDQVALYQRRRIPGDQFPLPPVVGPFIPLLRRPEIQLIEWDEWAPQLAQRQRLLSGFTTLPYIPTHRRAFVEVTEWEPWEPTLAQRSRLAPGQTALPYQPRTRRPRVEVTEWEEFDLVNFRHRRFLLIPIVPILDHGPSMLGAIDQPMTSTGVSGMIGAVSEPMIGQPRP